MSDQSIAARDELRQYAKRRSVSPQLNVGTRADSCKSVECNKSSEPISYDDGIGASLDRSIPDNERFSGPVVWLFAVVAALMFIVYFATKI